MAKFDIEESASAQELKKLAAEFAQMESVEGLRAANDAVEAQVQAHEAKSAGALPLPVVIGGIVLVIVLAVVAAFLVMRGRPEKLLMVPDVTGKNIAVARTLITDIGFRPLVTYDAASKMAPGNVIETTPHPGTRVKPGSDISLVVAGKAPIDKPITPRPTYGETSDKEAVRPATTRVTVPDVEGTIEGKAKSKLEALGLKVVATTTNDPAQPDRVVVTSDPKPDTQVDPGAIVHITVNSLAARTPEVKLLTVDNYVGRSGKESLEALKAKGFTASWRYEPSRQQPPGYVVRTEPAGGMQLAPGSPITVVIAR
ncbi:MAG TPA: PASTA domain-containing protein [Armatimonadota bacterium]|jgi:serine/threonine-protein kinase